LFLVQSLPLGTGVFQELYLFSESRASASLNISFLLRRRILLEKIKIIDIFPFSPLGASPLAPLGLPSLPAWQEAFFLEILNLLALPR